jgi:hypothetical protein
MQSLIRFTTRLAVFLLMAVPVAFADGPRDRAGDFESFETKVRPILVDHPFPVSLAPCLWGALLLVVTVAALTVLARAVRRFLCHTIWREICVPRHRVGQEIFRS